MGLGNWVKQVTRNESVGADAQVDRSPVQIASSCRQAETASPTTETLESRKRPPLSRWIGFIDRVTPTSIEGWACDSESPDSNVTVEAVISDGKRVLAVAHLYRRDVEEAGYGDGRCGFFLDLSKLTLKDESAIVRFAESKQPISVEPIEFDASRALLTTEMPPTFFGVMELCAAEIKQAAEVSGVII